MSRSNSAADASAALTACRHQAMVHLWDAYATAQDLREEPWQFACQLETLLDQGITDNALRWLLRKGYAEHRRETTAQNACARRFRSCSPLHFTKASCFIVTASGIDFADRLPLPSRRKASDNREVSIDPSLKPHWDADRRVLGVCEVLVKQFKVPAENQALILTAFEEDGWPARLDDPLPRADQIDPKRRLHDAIYRLNGNQRRRLIRFHGDGQGTGVQWELLSAGRLTIERR